MSHPASGIRNFEKMYTDMAEYLGINPASKKTIEFDDELTKSLLRRI